MLLYRIGRKTHIRDLSGAGARDYEGRWNHKGIPVVYTSETRALATVEYLVHVDFMDLPNDLGIAAIEVPDDITPSQILIPDLPANWRSYSAPSNLADIGTQWALTGKTLLLRVPSAVVDHEFNVLINPAHPDIRRVTIIDIEDYIFDERLLH